MAQLTGKTEEKITEELVGVIFKNPLTDQWESGDEYLSGNVRHKLNTARTFAENHPEFTSNVRALEAVQPRDLEASEIEVRIGATWNLRIIRILCKKHCIHHGICFRKKYK